MCCDHCHGREKKYFEGIDWVRHRAHGSGAGIVLREYFLPFSGPREKESTYKNTLLAAVPSKWLTVLSVLTTEVCQQRLIAI